MDPPSSESSPAPQSVKVHILDQPHADRKTQMRIRMLPSSTFAQLCDIAAERYLKLENERLLVQTVQDCEGNNFSLDDQIDQLCPDEVVFITKSRTDLPAISLTSRSSWQAQHDNVKPESQHDSLDAQTVIPDSQAQWLGFHVSCSAASLCKLWG